MLQSVKLQGTIRYDLDKIGQCDTIKTTRTFTHNETIDILCNSLFSYCQFFNGLDRSDFQKLLSLSVINCHFIFNGRLYQQVDGVAMGSPLGPLFANVFMSFHEQIWLQNCPSSFKPVLYRRYVDDCFLLFRSLNHVPFFLRYLNQQHPNITFTFEVERDLEAAVLWHRHILFPG